MEGEICWVSFSRILKAREKCFVVGEKSCWRRRHQNKGLFFLTVKRMNETWLLNWKALKASSFSGWMQTGGISSQEMASLMPGRRSRVALRYEENHE